MSFLKPAVLRQVAYAHSVRGFIREILKIQIPDNWVNRVISDSDGVFNAKLDVAERRRENAEIKDVARDVRETISRISAVDAKISEISETVSRLAHGRRKRRGKHDVAGPVCLAIWTGDKDNTTLRGTLNTRVTYAAVIARHRAELASVGITSVAQFRRAIHAMQTRIHAANKKALLAAQDAARSGATPRANGATPRANGADRFRLSRECVN